MNHKNFSLAALALFILGFLTLALRPIKVSSLDETLAIEGIVDRVEKKEGSSDISIFLENNSTDFYINRATAEHNLSPEELASSLQGKEVSIRFADHWTPLDPFNTQRHVVQIELGNNVVFRSFP